MRKNLLRSLHSSVPVLKDAGRKTRDFLGFSSFFAVFLTFSKFDFKQKQKDAKHRFRPTARNRTGGTLFQGGFQRVFLLRKPPFFRFSQKNIVKFLCLRKEVFRIVYIYKKEDCDCRYCLYYSKGKCKLQWCCCYQDKVRTGSPFTSNMKIIIKRRKEQHDQLKNQN